MLNFLKTLNNNPDLVLTKEELEYLKFLIKFDVPIENEFKNFLENLCSYSKLKEDVPSK